MLARGLLADLDGLSTGLQSLQTAEQPGFYLPFFLTGSVFPPHTITNTETLLAPLDRSLLVLSAAMRLRIVGANDVANFWTINIRRKDTAAVVFSLNSISVTNSYQLVYFPTTYDILPISYTAIYINVVKTGSPGTLVAIPVFYVAV